MNALELKVLKYINKKDTVSESDILKHFSKTNPVTIKGILFNLNAKYDYVRESNSIFEITDKGQIIAISDYIDRSERLKERIWGYVIGFLSGLIIELIVVLLI